MTIDPDIRNYPVGSHLVIQLVNKTVISGIIISIHDVSDKESSKIQINFRVDLFDKYQYSYLNKNKDIIFNHTELDNIKVLAKIDQNKNVQFINTEVTSQDREMGYLLRDVNLKDSNKEDWMKGDYDDSYSLILTKALRLGLLILINENELINPVTAIARILVSLTEPSVIFTKNDDTENIVLLNISQSGMGISGLNRKDIESTLKYLFNPALT